jgi:hypothetical protein
VDRDAPDTAFAGHPAGRIPDIRPDTWLDNYIFGKISNEFMKTAVTIIDFCKRQIKHDLPVVTIKILMHNFSWLI